MQTYDRRPSFQLMTHDHLVICSVGDVCGERKLIEVGALSAVASVSLYRRTTQLHVSAAAPSCQKAVTCHSSTVMRDPAHTAAAPHWLPQIAHHHVDQQSGAGTSGWTAIHILEAGQLAHATCRSAFRIVSAEAHRS